jgi:hypothetical protein
MAARWRAPSRCEEGVIRHKRAPVAFFVHPHSQPAPLRLINSCQCIFLGPSAQGDNRGTSTLTSLNRSLIGRWSVMLLAAMAKLTASISKSSGRRDLQSRDDQRAEAR